MYNHKKIEKKIQQQHTQNKKFIKKKKYYCLCMLPYPSGNLHMGHVRNYVIGDIITRYQILKNKNVLHPIGWDAFGLPAENAAIKKNISPYKWVINNIYKMKKQLKKLGIKFNWEKEITTCDSKYYKWEQWLFITLFNQKLIYKKKALVNWCNQDKTVLANEQVINGKCWRCYSTVYYKYISQWFIKTKKYANKLLKGIKKLKNWPKKVKEMQKNWIGKSKGLEILFYIPNFKYKLYIYTSNKKLINNPRCISISQYHDFIQNNINKKTLNKINNQKFLTQKNNYIGFDTHIKAINPINNKIIPIWITNFTEQLYNTQVILIFSNVYKKHDYFLKKYHLLNKTYKEFNCFKNIKTSKYIKKKTHFKLKDWVISRQRYWGVPIPIIKKNNKSFPVKIKKLPIKLPLNLKIKNSNLNPLRNNKKWRNIFISKNIKIKRETDTFDTFIESSWYYVRYTSPNYNNGIFDVKKANYWLPIDVYIGGIEHATMHLIYFRLMHKIFNDLKLIKCKEPAKKIICQGMILSNTFFYFKKNKKIWVNYKNIKKHKDKNEFYLKKNKKIKVYSAGISKMSKSKKNGINPNQIIKKYGADTLRLYIIFLAPVEKNVVWEDKGIKGCHRFLHRLFKLVIKYKNKNFKKNIILKKNINSEYLIIKEKILYIIKNMQLQKNFNVIIAKIMEINNFLIKNINYENNKKRLKQNINKLLIMINPFTPHISIYLWNKINKNKKMLWSDLHKNNLKTKHKSYIIIVQVNGIKRGLIKLKKQYEQKKIESKIKKKQILDKYLANKKHTIIKIIYIKNKVINFVINFHDNNKI